MMLWRSRIFARSRALLARMQSLLLHYNTRVVARANKNMPSEASRYISSPTQAVVDGVIQTDAIRSEPVAGRSLLWEEDAQPEPPATLFAGSGLRIVMLDG